MYNFSLPIKIGTTVYRVNEGYERRINNGEYHYVAAKIQEGNVSMLQQKADETWKFRVSWKPDSFVGDFVLSDLGKEIFLTEEEAKKRLEDALNGK